MQLLISTLEENRKVFLIWFLTADQELYKTCGCSKGDIDNQGCIYIILEELFPLSVPPERQRTGEAIFCAETRHKRIFTSIWARAAEEPIFDKPARYN